MRKGTIIIRTGDTAEPALLKIERCNWVVKWLGCTHTLHLSWIGGLDARILRETQQWVCCVDLRTTVKEHRTGHNKDRR